MGVRGVHGNIRCIYSSYPLCAIACLLQGKPFLQFSSFGMAPRDWRWDYFDKSDEHFCTHRTHHKTFCKACMYPKCLGTTPRCRCRCILSGPLRCHSAFFSDSFRGYETHRANMRETGADENSSKELSAYRGISQTLQ